MDQPLVKIQTANLEVEVDLEVEVEVEVEADLEAAADLVAAADPAVQAAAAKVDLALEAARRLADRNLNL